MNHINFAKLSGAGNDFIIIDNRQNVVPKDISNFVRKVCTRRVSVGADGLLLLENSDAADFKMRYFNADGGEVETCGNGARCIARFAYEEKVVPHREMEFETKAGIYRAQVLEGSVKLGMGDCKDKRLNFPLELSDGVHNVSFINSGVPHVVFIMDDLNSVDVVKLGRETRYHQDFQPQGTNANFITIQDKNKISIRTYERGVEDETLACGTGAIASAVIAGSLGMVNPPVVCYTRGGYPLKIHFELSPDGAKEVFLEGDARLIYKGQLSEEAWNY